MAIQHADIPREHMHDPYRWEPLDEAARLAIAPVAGDELKWARQVSDGTIWELLTVDPVAWRQIDQVKAVGTYPDLRAQATTAADVGLGNANNTSDSNKPVSTAQKTALDTKVDKVVGKGLSANDYTATEKSKLAAIEDGATADQTATEIKSAYESNLDTNAYTDAAQAKLAAIAASATANATDAQLRDRATHTGTQAASTVTGLAAVATTGSYGDLLNKPDLSALEEVTVYASKAAFPATGEANKVYIAEDTGYMHRWSGTAYVQLTDQTAIWGQVSGTLADQADLAAALAGKEGAVVAGSGIELDRSVEGQVLVSATGGGGGSGTIAVTQTLTPPPTVRDIDTWSIEASATSLLVGGSIASFVVTWWDGVTETVAATSGSATLARAVNQPAGGTVSATVHALDDIGNTSLPETVTAGVIANGAPAGPITISAPTQTGKNSVFQVSFTGATDPDGDPITYTVTSAGTFVFAKTVGITEGELVSVTAPDVSTDTSVTFSVVAEDDVGAQSATYSKSVTVLAAQVIGVEITATGGPGGTWNHIDEAGTAIASPTTSWFNGHPIFGGVTDVVVDGQDMVDVPKFYYKRGTSAAGNPSWWVSDQPAAGFTIMPAFVLGGVEKASFQVGKYQASEVGGKMQSVPGVLPWVNMSIGAAITGAEARNVSPVAGFRLWHYSMWLAIQWLYLIENATMDSQTATGQGHVNGTAALSVDNATVAQATYRGIVGLWGNVNQWLDGVRAFGPSIERKTYEGAWSDTLQDSPRQGFTHYPITFRVAEEMWLASTFSTTNDSTATCPDYHRWKYQLGAYFYPYVGDSWANGETAGLWYFGCAATDTDAYVSLGARIARIV